MASLREIYEEMLFLLPNKPQTKFEYAILLIHCINIKEGFKNNGVNENDEIREWVGIAEGWDNNIDGIVVLKKHIGVYSLRYQNVDKENYQFKFVVHPNQSDRLYINAIKLNQSEEIYSFELNIDQLNFEDREQLLKSNLISAYKKAILIKILKCSSGKHSQDIDSNKYQSLLQEPPQQVQPQGLLWNIPRNTPFQVGGQDISPFGNTPQLGGNLMGPQYFNQRQQQQQPSYNPFAPPGARIDPYTPLPNFDPFSQNTNQDPFGRGKNNNQFPF